ncbi:MAG: 1-acyl-sn-glycerol-3-phosphate acyltransferase [Tannerellaceae bacterium]|nr:1-acyl-sn-glycerol-3-phosphate acyltransferase [Tannerellaceae bacterium]
MADKVVDVHEVLRTKAPGLARFMPPFVVRGLAAIVHEREINEVLNLYRDKDGVAFMAALLDYFDVYPELEGSDNLPLEGRHIFASNHPLGGMDGICLSAILGNWFDGNICCIVNDLLLALPNLQSICLPVNRHGPQGRVTALLTDTVYASDCQVITFPAGKCSRRRHGRIADPEWKHSFVRKAVEYERDIVPIFFGGRNSAFFYRLANLRTAFGIGVNIEMLFLADELFRARHSRFVIRVGKPIPWQTFHDDRSWSEWADYVRRRTYALEKPGDTARSKHNSLNPNNRKTI